MDIKITYIKDIDSPYVGEGVGSGRGEIEGDGFYDGDGYGAGSGIWSGEGESSEYIIENGNIIEKG